MIEFRENYKDKDIKDIVLKNDNKQLRIFFGGNLDLYFDIYEYGRKASEIIGAKIDYLVKNEDEAWIYFNRLYNRIVEDKKQNERVGLVKDNIINWYSDEIYDEKANKLSIERLNEGIRLTFLNNPDDPSIGFGIRICNFGSKYEPFNKYFMKMFQEFQELAKQKDERVEDKER